MDTKDKRDENRRAILLAKCKSGLNDLELAELAKFCEPVRCGEVDLETVATPSLLAEDPTKLETEKLDTVRTFFDEVMTETKVRHEELISSSLNLEQVVLSTNIKARAMQALEKEREEWNDHVESLCSALLKFKKTNQAQESETPTLDVEGSAKISCSNEKTDQKKAQAKTLTETKETKVKIQPNDLQLVIARQIANRMKDNFEQEDAEILSEIAEDICTYFEQNQAWVKTYVEDKQGTKVGLVSNAKKFATSCMSRGIEDEIESLTKHGARLLNMLK